MADILRLDERFESAKDVARDVIGVFSEIPEAIGDLINRVKMGNERFTTGRFVEEAQEVLRENNNQEAANLLQKKLADNPNIVEEELTIEDLSDLGIDMFDGRTELVGEKDMSPEAEPVGMKFGQQRNRAFEYESIDENGDMDMSERTTRDMVDLDPLLEAAEGETQERWEWVPPDQRVDPDPDVEKIQSSLEQVGVSVGEAGVDGFFGDDTQKAVRTFQEQYNQTSGENIEVDGVVGPETLNALQRAIEEGITF